MCWAAREAYGEDDPRWREFRDWMIRRSPTWLFRLYMLRGPSWAQSLRKRPWLKPAVRGVMNLVLRFDKPTRREGIDGRIV